MEKDIEFIPISELMGTNDNVYPIVYALKTRMYNDFIYVVVREAFFVGVSIEDGTSTEEVCFFDEDNSEILIDEGETFPYNSLPSAGVFLDFDAAKEFSTNVNNQLLEQYSKTHSDEEVEEAKVELEESIKEEKDVYKEYNKGKKNLSLFSTVYVKTKYPN